MQRDETRNPADLMFAEEVGRTMALSMRGGVGLAIEAQTQLQEATRLLAEIEERVLLFLGKRVGLQPVDRSLLTRALTPILETIARTQATGVPTLRGMKNGFGMNPVVNILDASTLEGFGLASAEIGQPEYELRYSPGNAEHDSRIELTSGDDARRSVLTLLIDAVRFNARAPATPGSGTFGFTVRTTKIGYILASWPQWGVTRLQFGGTKKTTPVVGQLKSGRYHFEGKKGTSVENDGSLSRVGSSSTSTTLNW